MIRGVGNESAIRAALAVAGSTVADGLVWMDGRLQDRRRGLGIGRWSTRRYDDDAIEQTAVSVAVNG